VKKKKDDFGYVLLAASSGFGLSYLPPHREVSKEPLYKLHTTWRSDPDYLIFSNGYDLLRFLEAAKAALAKHLETLTPRSKRDRRRRRADSPPPFVAGSSIREKRSSRRRVQDLEGKP
jgi:hypothetical protein